MRKIPEASTQSACPSLDQFPRMAQQGVDLQPSTPAWPLDTVLRALSVLPPPISSPSHPPDPGRMPPRGSRSDFPAQVSPCSHPMSHPGLFPELGRTPSLTPGVSTSDRARSWGSPAGTLEGVHEVTTPTPGGDSSKTGLTCGGRWQQGLDPTGWTQDAVEGALRPAWDAVEGGMTAHSRCCVLRQLLQRGHLFVSQGDRLLSPPSSG